MKRCSWMLMTLLIAAIMVSSVSSGMTAHSESAGRKLTLMVYMCGSNLESGYGAASADIEEMKAAAPKGRDVTVLVMTGGAEQWSQGYDPAQCLIHEIGPRGTRVVWRSEALNMGAPETLTRLLRFGQENAPAEDYALILWNHGGGPLEGVCWDELFSLDQMTLSELTEAIRAAGLPKKLSWIGFDACLMGSLEVACALAPYAEYMIASQETEPAMGWNYRFLSGLAEDADGAAAGRRIVDAFFENPAMLGETLTLSCLDLSLAEEARAAMNGYFAGVPALDDEGLARVSVMRSQAMSYGGAVKGADASGYDLVDLSDLLGLMDQDGRAAELKALLDRMVVASRSNRERAGGLSVYFPFDAKARFRDAWREQYSRLSFSDAYFGFINAYGSYLLGEDRIDWSGLRTEYLGRDGANHHHFSLPLTQEQRAGLLSAELLVFQEMPSSRADDRCFAMVGDEPARLENGVILADYANRSLRVKTEQQTIEPLTFYTSKDGGEAIVAAIYSWEKTGLAENQVVFYYLDRSDEQVPEVTQIRVSDEATHYSTNRIAFSEEGFDNVLFWTLQRTMPDVRGNGTYPAYAEWPSGGDAMLAWGLGLPTAWHFEYSDEPMTERPLWAVFQLTDVHQNTFCTAPVPLDRPWRTEARSDTVYETERERVRMTAAVNGDPKSPSMELRFDIENRTGEERQYSFQDVVLNGVRQVEAYDYVRIPGGQTGACTVTVSPSNLFRLGEVGEIAVSLTARRLDEYGVEAVELRFPVSALDVSAVTGGVTPLAEAEAEDAGCALLSLRRSRHGMSAMVLVENRGPEPLELDESCVLNDAFQVDDIGGRKTVMPGGSRVMNLNVTWDMMFDSIRTHESEGMQDYYFADGLKLTGSELSRLTLGSGSGVRSFRMELTEPWALYNDGMSGYLFPATELVGPDTPASSLTLAADGRLEVTADWVVPLRYGVAVRLTWRNRTDAPMPVGVTELAMNGEPCLLMGVYSEYEAALAPGAAMQSCLCLLNTEAEPGRRVDTVSFRLSVAGAAADEPCVLRLPPEAVWTEAGLAAVPGGAVSADPVAVPAASPTPAPTERPTYADPLEAPGETAFYRTRVALPENAGGYARWLAAPLTEEQRANMERGAVLLARPTDTGGTEVLALLSMTVNAEGEIGAETAGLAYGLEGEPDMLLLVNRETRTAEGWQVSLAPTLYVHDQSYETYFTVDRLRISLDPTAGTASVTEVETTGETFERGLSSYAKLLPYEIRPPYNAQGKAPYLSEFETVYSFEWYLNCPEQILDGRPIRIAARPLTELEGVVVMFSVQNKDGSGYTLPPAPYAPLEE